MEGIWKVSETCLEGALIRNQPIYVSLWSLKIEILIYLKKWTKISQSLSLSLSVSVSQSQSLSLSFSVLVSQSQYLSPSFSVSAFQSQSLSLSFSDSGRKEVRKERRKENILIYLKKSTN